MCLSISMAKAFGPLSGLLYKVYDEKTRESKWSNSCIHVRHISNET